MDNDEAKRAKAAIDMFKKMFPEVEENELEGVVKLGMDNSRLMQQDILDVIFEQNPNMKAFFDSPNPDRRSLVMDMADMVSLTALKVLEIVDHDDAKAMILASTLFGVMRKRFERYKAVEDASGAGEEKKG